MEPPPAAAPSRPRPRRRRGVLWGLWAAWTLLGLALVLIVGLDLALRLAFTVKDALRPLPAADPRLVARGYGGASWVGEHFAEVERVEAGRAPYVEFRVRPFSGSTIHVDRDGSRRTWQPPTPGEDPGASEVLVLGGSSAWGLGARDDYTIPSLLAADLSRRGLPVRVVNLAQIGHVHTQGVIALMLELRAGRRPDVVVFHDGVNDVLAAVQSGAAGDPQNEANRRAEFNILQSPSRLLGGFLLATARESAFRRAAESTARRLGITGAGRSGIPFGSHEAAEVVRIYAENLRLVEVLARQYGFRAVCAWQGVVFTKRQPTDFEAERAAQYDWLRGPFALVGERLGSITPPEGGRVRFRDLSHALDGFDDLLFVDFCHTTEAANRILAGALAEDVAPLLVPDPPPVDAGGPRP